MVGPPSCTRVQDGLFVKKGGGMDKGMRIIFIIMGVCIFAGVLCVIFAVTHNIR